MAFTAFVKFRKDPDEESNFAPLVTHDRVKPCTLLYHEDPKQT